MKKLAIAVLATTMISSAAFAAGSQPAATDQNPTQQPAQKTEMQNQKTTNSNQAMQNDNQPISVQNLSRKEIRQVQQALNKNGEHVGSIDGRWGPKTEEALKQFEQAKNIPANGQLDRQTVASLGLNTSEFSQAQAK